MRDFIINLEKQKQVIKKKKQDMPTAYKLLQKVSKICVYAIIVILTIVLIVGMSIGFLSDTFLVLLVLSFFVILICGVLSLVIRALANNKYMGIWMDTRDCELHLKKNAFEYGASTDASREYTTWNGRYDEIERLEYDEYNCCLRIYGAITVKEWTDQDRTNCLDTSYIEKTWSDSNGLHETVVTIVDCFDDFDIFMEELSKKTGKQIVLFRRDM